MSHLAQALPLLIFPGLIPALTCAYQAYSITVTALKTAATSGFLKSFSLNSLKKQSDFIVVKSGNIGTSILPV